MQYNVSLSVCWFVHVSSVSPLLLSTCSSHSRATESIVYLASGGDGDYLYNHLDRVIYVMIYTLQS